MRPAFLLLAMLAVASPRVAAAHPCETEVADLAGKVTSLENLVAADREAVNAAASDGPGGALAFDSLERKLQADAVELQLAWQRLLELQERCNRLVGDEDRVNRVAPRPRVSIDLKVAYAIPVGDLWGPMEYSDTTPISSAWTGAVPIEVAARYRFTPGFSAGVYFQWGPAFTAATPFVGISGSTSGSDMRVGLELMYEFGPTRTMNPWLLVGTGWDWTNYSGPGASVTMSGWEYLNLQAGLDFTVASAFGIGPYVGILGGNYTNIIATGGLGGAVPPGSRAFHAWIQFGLKGTATF